MLRLTQCDGTMIYTFGPYRFLASQRSLQRDGEPCEIGSRATDILTLLLEHAGEVVSKDTIVSHAWPSSFVEESSIRVQIASLRKALDDGDREKYVRNIPGRGYCFIAPVEREAPLEAVTHTSLPATSATRPTIDVPPPLKRMIGRDGVVAELVADILDRRFVTVVASGGIGKTTVAVAAAHQMLDEFEGHVYYYDLVALKDAAELLTGLANVLGLNTSVPNLLTSIVGNLDGRRLLLVLDNCEHIVEDVSILAESLFDALPGLHILATSREALRVEGEIVLHLQPLEAPPPGAAISAADIESFPAVQLFFDRAAAAGLRGEPGDEDASKAAQICHRLDGIPLALELAAGRAGAHGISGVVQLLENRFRLHWRGRRAALPRHQTLRSMFDWSYNLLTREEQALFRALSVFNGGFTPEMAIAVAAFMDTTEEEVFDLCESLAEKSLISLQTGQQLYRLTETARAYAGEALQQHEGELARASQEHASYFLAFTRKLTELTPPFERWGEQNRTSDLLANVRSALRWCFSEDGNDDVGVALIASSWPLFYEMGLLTECGSWAAKALATATELDLATEASLCEAVALTGTMAVHSMLQVKTAYSRCLELCRELGDVGREMRTLAAYNVFITRIGKYQEGLEAARDFEALSAEANIPKARLLCGWMNGTTLAYLGSFAQARHYLEAAVPRYPLLDLSFTAMLQLVRARSLYARTLWIEGETDRALQEVELALEESRTYGNPVCLAIALTHGAGVFLWSGNLDRAQELAADLHKITASNGLPAFEALAIGIKGEVALSDGRLEEAEALLNEALVRADAQMHANTATTIAAAQAECAFRAGRTRESLDLIDRAIGRATETGERFKLAELLRLKATFIVPTNAELAAETFRIAISTARQQGARAFQLKAAVGFRDALLPGTEDEAHAAVAEAYHSTRPDDAFEAVDRPSVPAA